MVDTTPGKPGWREPMLASLTKNRFSHPGWIYERKLDGVRALGSRDGDSVTLWSRSHHEITATYPEIATALARQGGKRFIVDGEIVAFDGHRTSFAKLQPRIQLSNEDQIRATGIQVFYYLFDLLYFDDFDATALPLRQRKGLLKDAFDYTDPLRFSAHRNTEGEKYFAEACALGWEGLVAKRADSPYRQGRSDDWLKFKCVTEQEFVVGGFTEPQGSRQGFGALLVGYYQDGKLRYAGKVGTGYSDKVLTQLKSTLDTKVQVKSPFSERIPLPRLHWVEPNLVIQVGFSEWTADGRLRHPRYLGLRTDKDPREVFRELL